MQHMKGIEFLQEYFEELMTNLPPDDHYARIRRSLNASLAPVFQTMTEEQAALYQDFEDEIEILTDDEYYLYWCLGLFYAFQNPAQPPQEDISALLYLPEYDAYRDSAGFRELQRKLDAICAAYEALLPPGLFSELRFAVLDLYHARQLFCFSDGLRWAYSILDAIPMLSTVRKTGTVAE